MKGINKFLNINPMYMFTGIVVLGVSIFLLASKIVTIKQFAGIIYATLFVLMYHKVGSSIIKRIIYFALTLYFISVYTNTVINTYGLTVEPFFLSLASITAFASATSNNIFKIRNTPFWTAMLASSLSLLKTTMIMLGLGFLFTEIIGLNFLVLYTYVYMYWINSSKKTKINAPTITKDIYKDNFNILEIKESLNVNDSIWDNGLNAYSFLFLKSLDLYSSNKHLVLISTSKTSNIYDVGYINTNRSKIPYLYIENSAGMGDSIDIVVQEFKEEIL